MRWRQIPQITNGRRPRKPNPMSLVMLATDCDTTWIIANQLRTQFDLQAILIEPHVDRKKFLRRRAQRLGYTRVIGQVAFQLFSRALAFESRARRAEILARNKWDTNPPEDIAQYAVPTANHANQTVHSSLSWVLCPQWPSGDRSFVHSASFESCRLAVSSAARA